MTSPSVPDEAIGLSSATEPESEPSFPESRTGAFSKGSSPGHADTIQAHIAPGYHPDSIGQQLMPSGNGLSDKDAGRLLPDGSLRPSGNGMSDTTYQQSQMLENKQFKYSR